jgi:hypothetical protein
MIQKLSTPVSVILTYDHQKRKVSVFQVWFEGKPYKIEKIGFHHVYREGRTLFHVFSVASQTIFFRLVLNTDDLHWTLEEVADGETN